VRQARFSAGLPTFYAKWLLVTRLLLRHFVSTRLVGTRFISACAGNTLPATYSSAIIIQLSKNLPIGTGLLLAEQHEAAALQVRSRSWRRIGIRRPAGKLKFSPASPPRCGLGSGPRWPRHHHPVALTLTLGGDHGRSGGIARNDECKCCRGGPQPRVDSAAFVRFVRPTRRSRESAARFAGCHPSWMR
jgi:hypothetical protein